MSNGTDVHFYTREGDYIRVLHLQIIPRVGEDWSYPRAGGRIVSIVKSIEHKDYENSATEVCIYLGVGRYTNG